MTAFSTPTGGGETIGAYLQLLRRRWWLVLAALVIAPSVAYVVTSRQATHYDATAQVLLLTPVVPTNSTLVQPVIANTTDTLTALARSTPVAELAVSDGRLGISPGTFLAETGISFSADETIAYFTATTPDAASAPRLANAYANAFVGYRYTSEIAGLKQTEKTIKARMARTSPGPGRSALARELQQVEIALAIHVADSRVLQEAAGAAEVRPPTKRNVALGLVLGLVLGIGLAFLLDALDTRVRTVDVIEERLGLPILARLPRPSRALRKSNGLAMVEQPMGPHSEAFRMLRTNLELAMLDRDIRTVMITSAWETEGKSTTIANLAAAFARAGRRVTLVDLDLRRPMMHQFFPLGDRPGLVDVVLGHASLDQALARFDFRGNQVAAGTNGSKGYGWPVAASETPAPLSVLPLGPVPPNPGEFAASRLLANLLEMLRERGELVLIDAPPLFHVGDGLALSAHVDAVLLAVKLDIARRPELTRLRGMLETTPAQPLGVVVTGISAADHRYYGYGYGAENGSGSYYSRRRQRSSEAASR
jgi:Mrp family chromosome partitioning ATPase